MNSLKKLLYTSALAVAVCPFVSAQIEPTKPAVSEEFQKDEPARDTTTGKDFELGIEQQLKELGYEVTSQIQVGTRPNGRKHNIDLIAVKNGKSYLISLKWQQSSGTAEQKVPYEMICLSEALKQSRGKHAAAYLVLGGDGWTLKKFYLNGGLDRHLSLDQPVKLLSSVAFLKLAATDNL